MDAVEEDTVEEDTVEEVELKEEAGAVADAHLASFEHSRTKTRDSPILMMAEQPILLETTPTTTHTDGETTLVMTVPIAATRICIMR